MKLVKNFLLAVLLVSAIAVNTPAGELDTPGYAPPPPRITTISDTPTSGDTTISSSDTEQTGDITAETSDYLIFKTLEVLLSVY